MRTTILLDDRLGERLRAQARREGKTFSAYLADAGLKALESNGREEVLPFQLVTFRGEGAVGGINLDQTSKLVAEDDVAIYSEHQR